jgi:HD superfamily phosphodiesterase
MEGVMGTGSIFVVELAEWAQHESKRLLAGTGDRWLHVQGVVGLARQVVGILAEDERPVLLAAAHLHDVGYAAGLRRSGAHQLDGAQFLRMEGQERLACIVAHHSEARYELKARGLGWELEAYQREDSVLTDALTYCDLLTGPTGKCMSLSERVAEVERRYGEGTLVVDALRQALPALRGAVERTRLRLGGETQAAIG